MERKRASITLKRQWKKNNRNTNELRQHKQTQQCLFVLICAYLSGEHGVAMLFVIGLMCNLYGKHQNKEQYEIAAIKNWPNEEWTWRVYRKIIGKHEFELFCEVKIVRISWIFMRAIFHQTHSLYFFIKFNALVKNIFFCSKKILVDQHAPFLIFFSTLFR